MLACVGMILCKHKFEPDFIIQYSINTPGVVEICCEVLLLCYNVFTIAVWLMFLVCSFSENMYEIKSTLEWSTDWASRM